MSLRYSQEKLFGYPLKSGAVSFGKINAQNAQALFLLNNSALISGSVSYETISVTIEAIKVSTIPFDKPTLNNFGQQTFPYRNKVWTVLEVTFGGIYNIGTEPCYNTYNLTAINLSSPEFSVS